MINPLDSWLHFIRFQYDSNSLHTYSHILMFVPKPFFVTIHIDTSILLEFLVLSYNSNPITQKVSSL